MINKIKEEYEKISVLFDLLIYFQSTELNKIS